MEIDYWKQKQKNMETKLRKIQTHKICFGLGHVFILYGVFLLILYTMQDINILTEKGIPMSVNPLVVFFVSGCLYIIYYIEEKGV